MVRHRYNCVSGLGPPSLVPRWALQWPQGTFVGPRELFRTQCDLMNSCFFNIFYWLCYYCCPKFSSFPPLHPLSPILSSHLPLSSCPWVRHGSSLATPFPILFLTSPCLFCAYQLCFLFPVPFPLPTDNPPNDLHIYDSLSVLLVCLVCFLDSSVDSWKFIAIVMFIVLIFFFLNKSL